MNEELAKIIKPRNAVKVFINEGNPNNRLIHIRAIVDDDQIVYRYWRYRTQYWQYLVQDISYFESMHKEGWLTVRGVDCE